MVDLMAKIEILYGLPGSGKSYYAKSQETDPHQRFTAPPRTKAIDVDLIYHRCKNQPALTLQEVVNEVEHQIAVNKYDRLILDGLITTNAELKTIITAIKKKFKNPDFLSFDISYWEKDVETCLWNDRGRRSRNSKITIENIPFEEPSEELAGHKIKIMKRKIAKKPDYKVWAGELGLGGNKFLQSDSWSLGGTVGSCWDDTKHTVDAEPAPVSFKEFDELLERICPNITFLKYKKVYNEVVNTKIEYYHDYYGGSTSSCRYICDLEKLYNALCEMKEIQPVL